MGSLFKMHLGKQYPAEWRGEGAFWIAYTPGAGCKRIVQALTYDNGDPIRNRADAETARMKLVGAGLAGDRVKALRETLTAKLATAQAELAEAQIAAAPRAAVPVADAWEAYEALPKSARPDSGDSTLEQYALQFRRFERWVAERHPEAVTLGDVTEGHATEYAGDLQRAGLSGATVNKHVALLRLVFRTLAKQAGLTADVWATLRPVKHRARGRRELTLTELQRVCETATGELRLLLAIGVYSGLRLADCALLRWDEIDFGQNVLMVTPRKTSRTSGKQVRLPLHPALRSMLEDARGAAAGEYVLAETAATYEGRRDTITDRVQRHLLANGIDVHAAGTGQQIKRDKGGDPERDEKGRVVLTATGKRAVVSVGFHSLRHSFVSMCRAAGVSLSVVEALVGHANPNVTRLYTHTSGGEAEQAVRALPTFGGDAVAVTREPLPSWAREIVEGMGAGSWRAVRAALLKGGAV